MQKLLQDRPECVESPPTIDGDKNEVKIECDCRRLLWGARLMRWILCGMFANMGRMRVKVEGMMS